MRFHSFAIIVAVIALASASNSGDLPLTPRTVHQTGFIVVGIHNTGR